MAESGEADDYSVTVSAAADLPQTLQPVLPSRATAEAVVDDASTSAVGAARLPIVATADARGRLAGRFAAAEQSTGGMPELVAHRDHEYDITTSQPAIATSRPLYRSQSAACADRLGYRFGGTAAVLPLGGWSDEAYGTVRSAAAAAATSDGLHACSIDLEQRLTLGLPSTRNAVAVAGTNLQAASGTLCACGRRNDGSIASVAGSRGGACVAAATAAASEGAVALCNGRGCAGAVACQCSPVTPLPAAPADEIDRRGATTAVLERRSWRFGWGRFRKSDTLPSAGATARVASVRETAPTQGDDVPVGDVPAELLPLAGGPSAIGASSLSPHGKRKSKVCKKCSQLVKAIRKRFSRKRSRGKNSWTNCSTLSGMQRRRSASTEDVTYDFDQRGERPSEVPEPAVRLSEAAASAIVSSAASSSPAATLPANWMVATRHASRSPLPSPSMVLVVHNARSRTQPMHPVTNIISGQPSAGVPVSAPGTAGSLLVNFPRERHLAVRVAPGSPPPPGSARRVGGPLPSQMYLGALPSQPSSSARSAAAAAAAATIASSSAMLLAYGSGNSSSSSGAVRAHTTVDYAHFLVPDLRSITSSAYYWCVMDRYEAERALEGKPEGTFLLRDSAQDDFLFSVSFRRYGRSLHARVEQRDHSFSFDAHDVGVFRSPTVTGLVEHYKDADSCLFFEPLLIRPLPRPQPLSLQQLARSAICGSGVSYDGVAQLPLPRHLVEYIRYYHYKHKVRSRTVVGSVGAIATSATGACSLPPSSTPLGEA